LVSTAIWQFGGKNGIAHRKFEHRMITILKHTIFMPHLDFDRLSFDKIR
jgi:hypothetical protein